MNIVVYGVGGHGRVAADCLESTGKYRVIGFLDDRGEMHGQLIDGVPILGGREVLPTLDKKYKVGHIVVGIADGKVRQLLVNECIKNGISCLGVVHPSALISSKALIEPTAMIFPGAVINVKARVGAFSIINTHATIEHDVNVSAYSHIAPGATLCGDCFVGEHSFVGAGSVVIQGVKIGKKVTIGAGSLVNKDIPDGVTAFGVPCKVQP